MDEERIDGVKLARYVCWTGALWIAASGVGYGSGASQDRRLSLAEYRDRMEAGWIGQMVGVGWGGPTEFKARGEVLGAERVPAWRPDLVNQFDQDDLYVEMTFLGTLERHGLDASARQAGIDFANSEYRLWHANRAGRNNLRAGIAPPDSGHPVFNPHADDIDYQIEADFSGLIAPGLPAIAIELGETFGRLMNHGDGLYGGQFIGALYSEAYFERDMTRLIERALAWIPARSQYAGMVRDVLGWHRETPDDWEHAWRRVERKYHGDPTQTHGLCSRPGGPGAFSIDAKLNGAYVLLGLLWGGGDPERTVAVAMRCGQDSDCNPSSAAGILFTTLGRARLPARFVSALDRARKFSHTEYDVDRLVSACERLARQAVRRAGGRVERAKDGAETFVIATQTPHPSAAERSSEPGPPSGARFSPEEMRAIRHAPDPGK